MLEWIVRPCYLLIWVGLRRLRMLRSRTQFLTCTPLITCLWWLRLSRSGGLRCPVGCALPQIVRGVSLREEDTSSGGSIGGGCTPTRRCAGQALCRSCRSRAGSWQTVGVRDAILPCGKLIVTIVVRGGSTYGGDEKRARTALWLGRLAWLRRLEGFESGWTECDVKQTNNVAASM